MLEHIKAEAISNISYPLTPETILRLSFAPLATLATSAANGWRKCVKLDTVIVSGSDDATLRCIVALIVSV